MHFHFFQVCISFENYKTLHPSYEEEDNEEKIRELQNKEPEETNWSEYNYMLSPLYYNLKNIKRKLQKTEL